MEIGGTFFLKPRKWCGISNNAVLHHFVEAAGMVAVKSKRAVSEFDPLYQIRNTA